MARVIMATDGCSGPVSFFYEKILRRPFKLEYCCDEHDLAYDEGVTAKDKFVADYRFFICLWEAGGRTKAILFFLAVTIFGWPYWWRAAKNRKAMENSSQNQ